MTAIPTDGQIVEETTATQASETEGRETTSATKYASTQISEEFTPPTYKPTTEGS